MRGIFVLAMVCVLAMFSSAATAQVIPPYDPVLKEELRKEREREMHAQWMRQWIHHFESSGAIRANGADMAYVIFPDRWQLPSEEVRKKVLRSLCENYPGVSEADLRSGMLSDMSWVGDSTGHWILGTGGHLIRDPQEPYIPHPGSPEYMERLVVKELVSLASRDRLSPLSLEKLTPDQRETLDGLMYRYGWRPWYQRPEWYTSGIVGIVIVFLGTAYLGYVIGKRRGAVFAAARSPNGDVREM